MADSFATQEAAVRAFINADVLTAWNVTKVYHSEPELTIAAPDLPVAFIDLADPVIDEEYSSVRRDAIRLEYTITGHFKKPETGTLHTAKMAKANALRSLLTTGSLYHGNNRDWLGDNYSPENTQAEATDNDYRIAVRFVVIILVEVG